MSQKHYIGDGVYVSDDGTHIGLSTERMNGLNIIFLDSSCIYNLLDYLEKSRNVKITIERKVEGKRNEI